MITFGLVAEGITDQIVIEQILYGFFNNPDIEVNPLQPERDATDQDLATTSGNWHKVFEYCKSDFFKEAFYQDELYIIIQIDTDVFFGDSISKEYEIPTRDVDNNELEPDALIEKVIEKFVDVIGEDFFEKYRDRIIFAIAVRQTECWLLPLYYTDKKKSKTESCLSTLNRALIKKEGFTIDAKATEYYRKIVKPYGKHKTIKKHGDDNPSLKIFLENLEEKQITFPEEDW